MKSPQEQCQSFQNRKHGGHYVSRALSHIAKNVQTSTVCIFAKTCLYIFFSVSSIYKAAFCQISPKFQYECFVSTVHMCKPQSCFLCRVLNCQLLCPLYSPSYSKNVYKIVANICFLSVCCGFFPVILCSLVLFHLLAMLHRHAVLHGFSAGGLELDIPPAVTWKFRRIFIFSERFTVTDTRDWL